MTAALAKAALAALPPGERRISTPELIARRRGGAAAGAFDFSREDEVMTKRGTPNTLLDEAQIGEAIGEMKALIPAPAPKAPATQAAT